MKLPLRSSIYDIRFLLFPLFLLNGVLPCRAAAAPLPGVASDALPSSDSYMQDGKALYASGQYMAALGKFMSVLRNDPTQPEARHYLTLVIDAMRQGPKNGVVVPDGSSVIPSGPAADEMRRMLDKRARLTMDLQAVPGVKVDISANTSQVAIDTPQLFADPKSGLREQGVPVLDRISAWLSTFGQQPVIIHCYPEEMQETSGGGSLFLHRYSELYNFFVQERKMPPQRFVSADLLVQQEAQKTPVVLTSTSSAVVVFETVGSQTAAIAGLASSLPSNNQASWLEFSIFSSRSRVFNPEEGEWASLDLAALSHTGVKSWKFVIVSQNKKKTPPVFTQTGSGNLLQRVSWDGHDQTSGSFVPSGAYVARLSATDATGVAMVQEMPLQVQRGAADAPFATPATSKKKKHTHTAKATSASAPTPVATAATPSAATSTMAPAVPGNSPATAADSSDTLIGNSHAPTPAPIGNAGDTSVTDTPSGDASHTIWKQVIQFDPAQDTLQPSVKSSLERIGKTLEVYPLQKVRIVGFAVSTEPSASELAKKRAETVRSILVNDYNVDQKRVIVAGGTVSDNDADTKVELSITN